MEKLQTHIFCMVVVVILILCIDQGDGHWKERDKENLQHDIELYRKMAEKVDREIENYYDDKEQINEFSDDETQKIKTKLHSTIINLEDEDSNEIGHALLNFKHTNLMNTEFKNNSVQRDNIIWNSNKPTEEVKSWPKFEDILSAMGKKYDWKNDRWIKVKVKLKEPDSKDKIVAKAMDNKSTEFHEKHKFSYRMIKLKSKRRRNIVVAVSAVR